MTTHHTPPERELVALLADELAQEIRRVDGSHTLGAGALAEALAPFIIDVSTRAATVPQGDALDARRYRWLRANACEGRMESRGPNPDFALNCDEPESEWDAAIDAARRAGGGSAMSKPDSRIFAWFTDDFATDKSATTYDPVVAGRWIAKGWPVTTLVLESLLAEAERKLSEAEIEIEQWKESAIKIENRADALQSRLDAVLRFADEIAADGCNYYVGQLLRAALGCATTGEGGE